MMIISRIPLHPYPSLGLLTAFAVLLCIVCIICMHLLLLLSGAESSCLTILSIYANIALSHILSIPLSVQHFSVSLPLSNP